LVRGWGHKVRPQINFSAANDERADFIAQIVTSICVFLHLSAVISRDYATVTEPPPHRLNKAREKKGKPPIGEICRVNLTPKGEVSAMYMVSSGAEKSLPIDSYFRRGHYRRLGQPDGDQRLVPVAPCVVGGNTRRRPLRDYLVKAY